MSSIKLATLSLDQRVFYTFADLPLPSMMLLTFGRPLIPEERYNLAKAIHPCSFYDPDSDSTWMLLHPDPRDDDLSNSNDCMVLTESKE